MRAHNVLHLLPLMIVTVILFSSVRTIAHADEMDEVMHMVHTPEDLERLYARDFETEHRIPSAPLTHDEFLVTKIGNCQDFANFSQDVLGRLGIISEIVYMKFRGLNIGHAVCMWKEGSYYNFFDNRKLVRTNMASLEGVLRTYYPDLECCTGCARDFDVNDGMCE